jgi:hypothetical protein
LTKDTKIDIEKYETGKVIGFIYLKKNKKYKKKIAEIYEFAFFKF